MARRERRFAYIWRVEETLAAKSVTLSDVAAVARVSVSTASKVLNGRGRVSIETRQRIQDAAERLDYKPNALAQFFATGRSFTIGVITENAQSIFARSVLLGAVADLGTHDRAALLFNADRDHARFERNIRKLQARRIDGLLIIGDELEVPLRSVSSQFSTRVAYARAQTDDPMDATFLPNSGMAGRLAAEHLVSIGRRRIAHIGNTESTSSREREAGFRRVLDANGLALPLGRHVNSDWTRSGGAAATRILLDTGERIDAIFCSNDQQALGAYDALTLAGIRVPDDIALVGVDNFESIAGLRERTLTTIDLNHTALGAAAAQYLLADGDATRGLHLQDCTLIIGRSTMGDAAPHATDALDPG
jgi:LacI family transcriptional regulator